MVHMFFGGQPLILKVGNEILELCCISADFGWVAQHFVPHQAHVFGRQEWETQNLLLPHLHFCVVFQRSEPLLVEVAADGLTEVEPTGFDLNE